MDYLDFIASIAERRQFERGEKAQAEEGEGTEEESEVVNFAKELETKLKNLKN